MDATLVDQTTTILRQVGWYFPMWINSLPNPVLVGPFMTWDGCNTVKELYYTFGIPVDSCWMMGIMDPK